MEGAGEWGLTVSINVGEKHDDNTAPLQVEGGEIEMVEQFTYLGSIMSRDGDVMDDIKARIAKASRDFGCLRSPIFRNPILSIPTKRTVYKATVLAVLLYGGETLTLKVEYLRCLDSFPNRCVRAILHCVRAIPLSAVETEADIKNISKQVWLGMDHFGHHHG